MQQQGFSAASTWLSDSQTAAVLALLVEKGRLLTLSDLDVEGIKEIKVSWLEHVRISSSRRTADSWFVKLLFWLVVLVVVGLAGF